MNIHAYTSDYTREGYPTNKSFSLFGKGAVSTACLALMLAPAWGDEKTLDNAFDLSGKFYGEGTLHYLQVNKLLQEKNIASDWNSSYILSEVEDSSQYNTSDFIPGILLRYEKEDILWSYDRRTGERVENPQEGAAYREVTIKQITPHYFTFAFSDQLFTQDGDLYTMGEGSASYENPQLDYTIDQDNFRFLYDGSRVQKRLTPKNEKIASITGVFQNTGVGADSPSNENYGGGAIRFWKSTVGNITGAFLNNAATTKNGGAVLVQSESKITGTLQGVFIDNSANLEGGAIWAYAVNDTGDFGTVSVEHIKGVFINNSAGNYGDDQQHRGGAILISGKKASASLIEGLFLANHVLGCDFRESSEDLGAVGGAIANGESAKIDYIIGDFIGNYVEKRDNQEDISTRPYQYGDIHGGAIMNYKGALIEHIIGDFYGNHLQGKQGYGGAIANQNNAHIEAITGGFVRNYVESTRYAAAGGAIYNNKGGSIGEISGNFVRNFATNDSEIWGDEMFINGFVSGGAIANYYNDNTQQESRIGKIIGNFYGNYVESTGNSYAQGGAISNAGREKNDSNQALKECLIEYIDGDFIKNYAKAKNHFARGGAIFTDKNSRIRKVSGNFYENYVYSENERAWGGAIRNGGKMDEIENAIFVGNYAHSVNGVDNGITHKEDIINQAHVKENTIFHDRAGGDNGKLIGEDYDEIVKGAHGGAIFNEGELTISAKDGNTTLFAGNYIVNGPNDEEQYREYEAIYCYSPAGDPDNRAVLTLKSENNGYIIFEDKINGNDYDLLMVGDSSSYIIFNETVTGATMKMEGINLILFGSAPDIKGMDRESYLKEEDLVKYDHSDVFRKSLFTAHSGTVHLADGRSTEYLIGAIHAYGRGNVAEHTSMDKLDGTGKYTEQEYATFTIDADIDNETADVITAFAVLNQQGEYTSTSTGRITISDIEVRSEEGEWKYLQKLQKGLTLQVLNYVEMKETTDPNDPEKTINVEITDKDHYEKFKENCPIELDTLDTLIEAKSKMNSAHILPASISLATTKTHNDSIRLVGFRDNLQSWADMDMNGRWVENDGFGSIQYDSYDTSDKKKVFTILAGEQRLTQSSKDGMVWGNDWTIRGQYGIRSILNLNELDLFSTIMSEQDAHLENFYLRNTVDWELNNEGTLTLDTMNINSDSVLTLHNGNKLVVRGATNLTGVITTDTSKGDKGEMVIDNKSAYTIKDTGKEVAKTAATKEEQNGFTTVQILGTVENQDITIKGDGKVSRTGNKTTDTYDTEVYLRVMDNGKASSQFENFKGNNLNMENGKFILLGGLGDQDLRLNKLTIGNGSIMAGAVSVSLADKKMGTITAKTGDYTSGNLGHIFVDRLNLTSSSKENEVTVKFTDKSVAGSVVPFEDEPIGQTTGESTVHHINDRIIEWNVVYNYDSGNYIFYKTRDKDQELEDKDKEIADKDKELDDLKDELEKKQKELEETKKELEEKKKELDDLKDELEETKKDLEQKEKDLEDLTSDLEDKKKDLETAQDDLKDAEDRLRDLENDLTSSEEAKKKAQGEVEQARKDLDKAREDLQKAQDAVDKAQSDVKEAQGKVADLEGKLGAAQEELTQREKELAEKEKRLKELEEELEKREEKPLPNKPSSSLKFNPAIMAGPVAEMMGGYASMQEVFNHSFEHAELYSATLNRARKERLSARNYTVVSPTKGGAATVRRTGGTTTQAGFKGGMWVRPYSSFERIAVYDGIKANVSLYGALVGGDSSLSEYRNGWASVFSGFVGYTGSTQKFSRRDASVHTTQNGGVVGITETLYYRNFYTAVTATIGTASAHATTTWGANGARGGENFHMLMGGVASRTGYSIELAKGRYVIQPTWQMSFTSIDMADYTNSDGVRVVSDTLYAFQIHPFIKAVMNTECGWNPYITAGYVHDFMAETSFHAEEYKLPSVSIDPYAEYGIGVQKTWRDTYTIYGQATGRNGGRNGVEISAGLRCTW